MNSPIKRLYAVGTKGKAKGVTFEAKKNSLEKFVLNIKKVADSESTEVKPSNKIMVDTLEEAYALLKQEGHSLNMASKDGQRTLCELSKIKVEYF